MTDYRYPAEYDDTADEEAPPPRAQDRSSTPAFFGRWRGRGWHEEDKDPNDGEDRAYLPPEEPERLEDGGRAVAGHDPYPGEDEGDVGGGNGDADVGEEGDRDGSRKDADEEPQPDGSGVPVAATGAHAPRRIRFDPTKERGARYFDRAHRHSRTVRGLKIALPVIAGLGVIGFFAFVNFAPDPESALITLSGINVADKSVTMTKPHISGFEGTRRSYEVRAVQAVQDLKNPKIVSMTGITARLGMGADNTAHVQAKAGVYNGDTNGLAMSDGITVDTTNGYKAQLQDAQVDITTGAMTSDKPLQVSSANAVVKAHGIEVQDRGKHVIFKNGVTVIYTPPADASQGGTDGQAADGTAKSDASGDQKPAKADGADGQAAGANAPAASTTVTTGGDAPAAASKPPAPTDAPKPQTAADGGSK